MKRFELKNKFNKERNIENWSEYKLQRKYCSNLLRHSKKHHFDSVNIKDETENKQFWKTVKPFFTDRAKISNNVILTENNQTVIEDREICQIFKKYFTNATDVLMLRQAESFYSFENEESSRL